ncbi:MAG: PilT/PilU family type 4a pilus ATPase [Candidatus Omnitrophota bacterium]
MDLSQIFDIAVEKKVSDIFMRAGSPLRGRVRTEVVPLTDKPFTIEEIEKFVNEMTKDRDKKHLKENRSCEFALWHKENWRFRISIFYQRDTPAMVIRKINLKVPNFEELNLPGAVLEKFCTERRGLILLTGITGSGKSTAIASMIEHINTTYPRHVLTIEEPIEFTFTDKKSMINQREIGIDVKSYEDALRQFALHSPDVIYIGNIRDASTCYAALTAAETGVLVFSTMHTVNASSTVERMINFFPPHQHSLILHELSLLLKGVISLRLIPLADASGLIPAYEIMALSPSVSRLLRENKLWELPRYISSGDVYGMKTFHQCLIELAEDGKISPKLSLEYADKKEELEMEMRNKGLI